MECIIIFILLSLILGEIKPVLKWDNCSRSGCTTQTGYIVSDVTWRDSETGDINYDQIGVTTSGYSLKQKFVTTYNGVKNVGSRLFLLESDQKNYHFFKLVNKEFTFKIDVSQLPCGLNAVLSTIEMGTDSSAAYGAGYCDAQFGRCSKMDIWKGNSRETVFALYPCSLGSCFAECKINESYFYGPGSSTVNSLKNITVITQFVGNLSEIRRLYMQDGKILISKHFSFLDNSCVTRIGQSLARGHVLAFSLSDSNDANWLDGPCPGENKDYENVSVTWSDIRVGDLDTTY